MTYVMWGVEWNGSIIGSGFDTRRNNPENDLMPVLFRTRAQARAWIRQRFGYLRVRPDLRSEPFNWKMARPVRVRIEKA